MKTNLLEYRHELSESDFQQLAKAQSAGRSGDNKLLDGIQTKNAIIKGVLSEAGYSPKDDPEKANLFNAEVEKRVIQLQDELGRKVTNQELRDISNGLMTEVVTEKGIFWDTTKKLFETTTKDNILVRLQDIPAKDVDAIKSALLRKNQPVTDDRIVDIYTQKIKMGMPDNG